MHVETIRRLADAKLTADTIATGVRLLALTGDNGYGRLDWDQFLALLGVQNIGAARRYMTRLKQAGVLTYRTNGFVEWTICAANDAPLPARNAPLPARGSDDESTPRAATSAKRAATSAWAATDTTSDDTDAPLPARNAPLPARNAPLPARGGADLIDDLIIDRWKQITNRSINNDETAVLQDAGDLVGKLLAELDARWPSIKAKRNVARYMQSILTTLRTNNGDSADETAEDAAARRRRMYDISDPHGNSPAAAAARRRKYIPDKYADIIIG